MKNQYAIVPYSMDGIGGECVTRDGENFGMTDRQVGEALGYSDPAVSIQNVLMRNKDELSEDGLSVTIKLIATDGKRYTTRTWTKEGVVRIAFLANTEKSKLVRSLAAKLFVAYAEGKLPGQTKASTELDEALKVFNKTKAFAKAFGLDKNQQLLTANRYTKDRVGFDPMTELQIFLPAPVDALKLMTPTEIGKTFNPPMSANKINEILCQMGYQIRVFFEEKGWRWDGSEMGEVHFYRKMVDGNGTRFQLVWYESVIPMIQAQLEVAA